MDGFGLHVVLNRLHMLGFGLGIVLLGARKAGNWCIVWLRCMGNRERSCYLYLQFSIWMFRLSWY
jgi:hypothetical protein